MQSLSGTITAADTACAHGKLAVMARWQRQEHYCEQMPASVDGNRHQLAGCGPATAFGARPNPWLVLFSLQSELIATRGTAQEVLQPGGGILQWQLSSDDGNIIKHVFPS